MDSGVSETFPSIQEDRPICWSYSRTLEDASWDAFLQSTDLGHFQQSAMWSKVKAQDGWQVCRAVLRREQQILGGFQLLHRQKGPLRLGYVTKGPVVLPILTGEQKESIHQAISSTAVKLGLHALVVQPPDAAAASTMPLIKQGCIEERLMEVIGATLKVALHGGIEKVERGMRRTTRREIRMAQKTGLAVCEGRRDELPTFFDLMLASCLRQGEKHPNPASIKALDAIWEAFAPGGALRLTFARRHGQVVAGLLCIKFGKLLSVWKKGALEPILAGHAMNLLYRDAFRWGIQQQLEWADFCALNPDIAATLVKKESLSEGQRKSRDFYNLGFGGVPCLLPPAMIFLPNPILRLLYRGAATCAPVRHWLKRLMH